MKNIDKKSWRDVTINEYFDFVERIEEEGLTDYEKEVIKISFVTGMKEDDVWSLTINEFRNLQVCSLWMDDFNLNENVKFNKIKINNEKYIIDTNLQNFTVAQYIDFQSFYPQYKKNSKVLGNILACFIIPEGKKYADGYDIQALVTTINNSLDIMTANEIMFFFLKQYLISTRAIANYLNWIMAKKMRKGKYKEEMEQLNMKWEEAKKNILDGLRSLTRLDN